MQGKRLYKKVRDLDEGTTAKVALYRPTNNKKAAKVAIKMLRANYYSSEEAAELIKNEADILRSLNS